MATTVRRATSADAALLSSLNAEVQGRQGVGAALIAAVRAQAASRNVALLGLDVWSFNADAKAFFQRQGFAPYNGACGAKSASKSASSERGGEVDA